MVLAAEDDKIDDQKDADSYAEACQDGETIEKSVHGRISPNYPKLTFSERADSRLRRTIGSQRLRR
jgi:hypothetical protein